MSQPTPTNLDHSNPAARPAAALAAEELGARLLGSAQRTLELFGVYLGDQLGY